MIRVMQVSTDTNIGGAGMWLLNFLKYYDRSSLDVVVVIPRESALKNRIEALDVRYIEADGIADSSFSVEAIGILKEIIEKEKPDAVHTHASLSARIAARMAKVPIVNTRHCLEPKKRGIKRAVYRGINNLLSDRVVAVSKAVYKNLAEDGIPEEKLRLVYNGVPALRELSADERKIVRMELGVDGCMTAGIFARLEPVKNHMLFLQAAAAAYNVYDRFRFLVVGTGSMEKALKAEAARLGIADAVIFTGYVEDITDYMNAVDINVLTSDFEAMSISLAEGMTLGKPCIATDAGGPREVVENGVSGIVVPVGDAVNLSAALLRLASDPDFYRSCGEEGRRIAAERFSPEEMCEKLLAVYFELAAKKG